MQPKYFQYKRFLLSLFISLKPTVSRNWPLFPSFWTGTRLLAQQVSSSRIELQANHCSDTPNLSQLYQFIQSDSNLNYQNSNNHLQLQMDPHLQASEMKPFQYQKPPKYFKACNSFKRIMYNQYKKRFNFGSPCQYQNISQNWMQR